MEFKFTPEEEDFREELRDFLKNELPDDWTGGMSEEEEDWEFTLEMRKKLAEKGWLTMAWPEDYGGQGASHMMNSQPSAIIFAICFAIITTVALVLACATSGMVGYA